MSSETPVGPTRVTTGVPGLDAVLGGGLPSGRTYLIRGCSGSGKTTLALQFCLEGARRGETVLYVMLTETRQELLEVARSHGFSLDGVHLHEVVERPDLLMKEARSTLFSPSEIELGETVQEIADLAGELRPARVVVDPLSELRLMADDPLRFRRQFLALKQVFADIGATALLVEEFPGGAGATEHLENVAHGLIALEQKPRDYGPDRRRVRVIKVRGISFMDGHHDLELVTGGLIVYPRLVETKALPEPSHDTVPTRLSGLDEILGGGVERGASTLITGQAGTGKSSLLAHMVDALCRQGVHCMVSLFEEHPSLFRRRANGMGMRLDEHLREGLLSLERMDPEIVSPGRLMQAIRDAVESGAGAVVIDSLSGLSRSMYDEPLFTLRIREMLAWLTRRGVITLISLPSERAWPIRDEFSHLADTMLLLRHVRRGPKRGKCISVLKRRGGKHDSTTRELRLTSSGLVVGKALRAKAAESWEEKESVPAKKLPEDGRPEPAPSDRLEETTDGRHP